MGSSQPYLPYVRISWSPDGRYRVVGDYGTVFVWDARKQREFAFKAHDALDNTAIFGLDWLPDGTLVTSGGDYTICFWKLENYEAKLLSTIYPPSLEAGHVNTDLTADRATIEAALHDFINSNGHSTAVCALATQGWLVASGSVDGFVKLWNASDPADPKFIADVFQHVLDYPLSQDADDARITDIKWIFVDGVHILLSSSENYFIHTLRLDSLIDIPNSSYIGGGHLSSSSGRTNIMAIGNNDVMAIAGEKEIEIIKFSSDFSEHRQLNGNERLRKQYDSPVTTILFSADKNQLAVGLMDGSIEIWDTRYLSNINDWKQVKLIKKIKVNSNTCMAFDPISGNLDVVPQSGSQVVSIPVLPDASTKGSGENDHETEIDELGFEPYVHALALFLTSPDTHPPLTVSLEGSWGTGKSSFMRMLERKIELEEFELVENRKQEKKQQLKAKIEQGNADLYKNRIYRWFVMAWQGLRQAWQSFKTKSADFQEDIQLWYWRQKNRFIRIVIGDNIFEAIARILRVFSNFLKFIKYALFLVFIKPVKLVIFFLMDLLDLLLGIWLRRLYQRVKNWLLPETKMYIVHFNPWHYQNANELWAAFAVEFMQQIGNQAGALRRARRNFVLGWQTFIWKDGGPALLRFVIQIIFFAIFVLIFLWGSANSIWPGFAFLENTPDSFKSLVGVLGGGIASIALGVALWQQYVKLFGNPDIQLQQYLNQPDYRTQVGFYQQFSSHFRKIIQAYVGNDHRRVYVFFDDLDRSDPHVAAELMQAISMLSADNLPLVSILAMDRAKVAASLAVRYQDMMPFLPAFEQAEELTDADKNRLGRDYGYEFIEKFVQIMFRLPRSGKNEIRNYIKHLTGRTNVTADAKPDSQDEFNLATSGQEQKQKIEHKFTPAQIRELIRDASVSHPLPSEQIRERVEDSEMLERETRNIAWVFDNNPRKLKIFTNLFRLRAYIVNSLGLLRVPPEPVDDGISLTQLAKMVAISIAWPRLVDDLSKDEQLLYRFYSNHEKYGQAITNYRMELAEAEELIDEFDREFPPPGDLWETDDQSSPWQTWKDNKQVQKLLFKDWHPTTEDVGDISNILLNNSDILLKAIE